MFSHCDDPVIRGSVASQSVRTSYISMNINTHCYIHIYVCAAVSGRQTSTNGSVPDRLVRMLFSDGFGFLNFYGLMLEQFVQSDTLALHWSIQPGVSDGCLELFSRLEAAVDHIEVVRRHWLGVGGPLLAMVQLQIRADRLYGFIQRGMMALEGGNLRVFAQ